MIETVVESLDIPVTVCGGCSNFEDIYNLANTTSVSGIAAGSVFVYRNSNKGVLISYPDIEEIDSRISKHG